MTDRIDQLAAHVRASILLQCDEHTGRSGFDPRAFARGLGRETNGAVHVTAGDVDQALDRLIRAGELRQNEDGCFVAKLPSNYPAFRRWRQLVREFEAAFRHGHADGETHETLEEIAVELRQCKTDLGLPEAGFDMLTAPPWNGVQSHPLAN